MHIIKNLEEIISGIALVIIITAVFINVIMRYIFSYSLGQLEEIAIICFAWFIFFGASACYKRQMHIRVDAFVNILSHRKKHIIELITAIFLFLFNIYLVYLTLIFSISAWAKKTNILKISYTFVDISLTIAFLLMSIHSFKYLLSLLSGEGAR